jgi:diguanylate cyclase (GGDEF)-like protein
VDHSVSSPSDAVLAVSRMLAPAGGPPDLAAARRVVVREARRFFRAPGTLLIEIDDQERRATVIGDDGAPDRDGTLTLEEIPALARLVDDGLERIGADGQLGPAELIALGGEAALLVPGPPIEPDALTGVFVNAAAAVLRQSRSAVAQTERLERQLALTRAAKTLNESLDLPTLLGRICHEARTLLDADVATVYQRADGGDFIAQATSGLPPEFIGTVLEPGSRLAGQAIERGQAMLSNDYRKDVALGPGSPLRHLVAALAVPFGWDDEVHGVLSIGWARHHRIDPDDVALLETFTELAGVACHNASAHAGLAQAAQTDSLTGCLNHAALQQHLARELTRAARDAAEPPSLVLIDLDHFKQVNDEHGHLTGDEVLRRVGVALRSGIRPYDIAARYGGDEFALLVTGADEDAALEVARRAVDRVSAAIAEFVDGEAAGATAGVAAWTSGVHPAELIARADRALLFGKRIQRGGVHAFSAVPEDWNRSRFERRAHERGLPSAPPMPAPVGLDPDERLRKRTRQLGLANALGARLAGMTDVSEILEATAEELHRAFGYFLCGVVKDYGDGTVGAAAVRGENFVRLGLQGWRQPRDHGLIGRCLRAEAPLLFTDVTQEPDYTPTGETVEVRSEMIAPLWVGDQLWGVLNVEEIEAGAFDEDDLRLLETVSDQVGAALRSASLYEQLERAYLGTAQALVTALEAKDAYTAEHARSIVEQAEAIGRALGMDDEQLRDLRFAAVFHDIGKIAVPEAILCKPGPLTAEERAVMERHTIIGEQILAPVEFLAGVCKLVRHEHERWDGAGYPDRLAGEAIPLGSRIILACDALHAMTSDRPYRKALPREVALSELRKHSGTQFDPRVVEALLAVVGAPEGVLEPR